MNENRKKKSIGARNKQKGSHAERFYARLFKELGYSHCVTARLGSRLHDNAGIDIMNIPYNVQIKAGIQKGLNAGKVLFQMETQIKVLFPPGADVTKYPLIVIHRPEPFSSHSEKDIVYMSEAQFFRFKTQNSSLEYDTIKVRKEEMNSEFRFVVSLSFTEFRDKIIMKKC